MIRARGGLTSYVGYGSLTLVLMYMLFLYHATKTTLNSCEATSSRLKEDKQELVSHLAVAQEHNKRLKTSVDENRESLNKCNAARTEIQKVQEECLRDSNEVKSQLKNKENELSVVQKEMGELRETHRLKVDDCEKMQKKASDDYNKLQGEKQQMENRLQDDLAKSNAQIQKLQQELQNLQQQFDSYKQQQPQQVQPQQGLPQQVQPQQVQAQPIQPQQAQNMHVAPLNPNPVQAVVSNNQQGAPGNNGLYVNQPAAGNAQSIGNHEPAFNQNDDSINKVVNSLLLPNNARNVEKHPNNAAKGGQGVAAFSETTKNNLLNSIIKRSADQVQGADSIIGNVLHNNGVGKPEDKKEDTKIQDINNIPERYKPAEPIEKDEGGKQPIDSIAQQPLPLQPLRGNDDNNDDTNNDNNIDKNEHKNSKQHGNVHSVNGVSSKPDKKGLGALGSPPLHKSIPRASSKPLAKPFKSETTLNKSAVVSKPAAIIKPMSLKAMDKDKNDNNAAEMKESVETRTEAKHSVDENNAMEVIHNDDMKTTNKNNAVKSTVKQKHTGRGVMLERPISKHNVDDDDNNVDLANKREEEDEGKPLAGSLHASNDEVQLESP